MLIYTSAVLLFSYSFKEPYYLLFLAMNHFLITDARAKVQSSVKEINTAEVLRYMITLINVALQIKEKIPLYTGEILGQSDFEEISDYIEKCPVV